MDPEGNEELSQSGLILQDMGTMPSHNGKRGRDQSEEGCDLTALGMDAQCANTMDVNDAQRVKAVDLNLSSDTVSSDGGGDGRENQDSYLNNLTLFQSEKRIKCGPATLQNFQAEISSVLTSNRDAMAVDVGNNASSGMTSQNVSEELAAAVKVCNNVAEVHNFGIEGGTQFKCDICSVKSTSAKDLQTHLAGKKHARTKELALGMGTSSITKSASGGAKSKGFTPQRGLASSEPGSTHLNSILVNTSMEQQVLTDGSGEASEAYNPRGANMQELNLWPSSSKCPYLSDANAVAMLQHPSMDGSSKDFLNYVTPSKLGSDNGHYRYLCMNGSVHNPTTADGFLETVCGRVVSEGKNIVLGNALVAMYAKCGALTKAQEVFDNLPVQDVVCWSALIAGYVQQGRGEEALGCFERMQEKGFTPNIVTFTCALRACGNIPAVDKGEQIHDEVARKGLIGKDIMLDNSLVDMYAKCGALEKARQVLQELPVRDVISWSALIAGYAQQGQAKEALNCFELMRREGVSPTVVTFTSMLKACASIGALDKGKLIHDELARQGLLGKDEVLGTALVDMYAKCGELAKARQLLEELSILDAVSWSALIAGYAQQGQGEEALNCYELMQCKCLEPNAVTYASVLKACGCIGAADKGEEIHDEIARQGLLENNTMLANALVDMYSKCGAFVKAQQVLDKLPVGDVISWSSLIAGYVQQGKGEEALNCFRQMRGKGFCPNAVTFTCILKACSLVGAADKGEEVHNEIAKEGLLENDTALGNALVDMYVKCGALEKVAQVLDELPVQDVVSWSTLIAGYAQQGHGQDALKCFERMQDNGFAPDPVTLACVLNACSHSGLVDEGQMYFANMTTKYGIVPSLEHYMCMVDLYGRAGHFDKAVAVIQKMPSSDYLPVWSALLGACRKRGDVSVGRWAFQHAVQVDRSDAAAYVCMGNIYAAAGMQEDAASIELLRLQNRAWKKSGNLGELSL